jgi:hypothetical protein
MGGKQKGDWMTEPSPSCAVCFPSPDSQNTLQKTFKNQKKTDGD